MGWNHQILSHREFSSSRYAYTSNIIHLAVRTTRKHDSTDFFFLSPFAPHLSLELSSALLDSNERRRATLINPKDIKTINLYLINALWSTPSSTLRHHKPESVNFHYFVDISFLFFYFFTRSFVQKLRRNKKEKKKLFVATFGKLHGDNTVMMRVMWWAHTVGDNAMYQHREASENSLKELPVDRANPCSRNERANIGKYFFDWWNNIAIIIIIS